MLNYPPPTHPDANYGIKIYFEIYKVMESKSIYFVIQKEGVRLTEKEKKRLF